MNLKDKYHRCLSTVTDVILDRAFDAKSDKIKCKSQDEDYLYEAGRLMGLHEAIDVIQQTAEAEGIDLKELDLDKIDTDRDLV